MVFVDKLTKMVHLTGCKKEFTPMEYPQIFVTNVFWLYGLPIVLISDSAPHFTDKFWRAMLDLLGTDLRFNTAFDLYMDGQSEWMI